MTRQLRDRRRARRRPGVLMVAGWLILLLAALSLVTWRQTQGVAMEQALRQLEAQRAIAEADRVTTTRRVEELRSRARVLRVASQRLGMHIPGDREIVFLPVEVDR